MPREWTCPLCTAQAPHGDLGCDDPRQCNNPPLPCKEWYMRNYYNQPEPDEQPGIGISQISIDELAN